MKFSNGVLFFTMLVMAIPVMAQQSSQPIEFIESTSPLPGGGVVSSVYIPGRGGPVYNGGPASIGPQQVATNRQSVLDPSLGYAVQPINQVPVASQAAALIYPVVPASAQIPNLGVPTNWNRSLSRSGNFNYSTAAGYTPQGSVPMVAENQYTQTTLSPQTPMVVQNAPPNAHVGRSIFGSPRQYVDGQPVRNLFRFVFP